MTGWRACRVCDGTGSQGGGTCWNCRGRRRVFDGLSPGAFAVGAVIEDGPGGRRFRVVRHGRDGVSVLAQEATGQQESWNSLNNPRFRAAHGV